MQLRMSFPEEPHKLVKVDEVKIAEVVSIDALTIRFTTYPTYRHSTGLTYRAESARFEVIEDIGTVLVLKMEVSRA